MLNDRLASIAVAATVAVMFFGLVSLEPVLRGLQPTHRLAGIAGGAVASIGVYRFLAVGLLWLFNQKILFDNSLIP